MIIFIPVIIGIVIAAAFIVTLHREQRRAQRQAEQKRLETAEKLRKAKEEVINNISSDFQSMPGWRDWDSSIHRTDGQLDRIKRAASEDMAVLAYDPDYSLAKVKGSSGEIYLTSCRRCSCPDYRERRLPCKHMYFLCMKKKKKSSKLIVDSIHKRLYGLTIALAGKFPGSSNGPDGFRAKLNSLGAIWRESVNRDCSALVCGTNPSPRKIELAQYYDMEVFEAEDIDNIFSARN